MKWVLVAIATSCILSCQKEESNAPGCSISMTGLSGTYKLTALKYQASAAAAPVDYLASMDACEKDDKIELSPNGTYAYSDMGVQCTPDNSSTGTWSIKENTFVCKENDILDQGTISTFDCRQLVIYRDNIIVQGDRMTLTLTKQ